MTIKSENWWECIPPHRCGMSRYCFHSMIIALVCLRLPATHLLCIELIRLWIVACGMLVHSWKAVWSCRILAETGTCCVFWSRASQTCSMGDMPGEYADHARPGMFSASRNCVQILAAWGCALSCFDMRWWSWMNGSTMGLRILSRNVCAIIIPSIKWTCICFP